MIIFLTAMRFAQVEVKLLLAKVILNFKLEPKRGHEKLVLAKVLNTLRLTPESGHMILSKA